MAEESILKAGRTWGADGGGFTELSRDYIVKLADVLATDGEKVLFAGVPAIGTKVHGLRLTKYKVKEGGASDKNTLIVSCDYERDEGIEDAIGDDEETQIPVSIVEWGWDDSTETKEVPSDINGDAIINSAGDPFDRPVTVSAHAPVFTKVLKTMSPLADAMACNCKLNDAEIVIGSMTCPAHTLLCTVAERRLINDSDGWIWQYTIKLRYKSNKQMLELSTTETECGWNAAIVDCGMRRLDDDNRPVLITMRDEESGKMCTVNSPALLNGQGQPADGVMPDDPPRPFVMLKEVYHETTIPDYFTSLPEVN